MDRRSRIFCRLYRCLDDWIDVDEGDDDHAGDTDDDDDVGQDDCNEGDDDHGGDTADDYFGWGWLWSMS